MASLVTRTVVIIDNGAKMRKEAGTSSSASVVGFTLQKTILTECNSGMLDYVRVFLALRSGSDNLCVFRAGKSVERITGWSSADQSLQAVVDGLSFSNQHAFPPKGDIKGSLLAALLALLEPQPSQQQQSIEREGWQSSDQRVLDRSTSRLSRASQGSQGSSYLNRALEGCGLEQDRSDLQSGRQEVKAGPLQNANGHCAEILKTSSTLPVQKGNLVHGRIILIQADEDSLSTSVISGLLNNAHRTAGSDSSLSGCEVSVLSVFPGGDNSQGAAPRLGHPENIEEQISALQDGSAFGTVEVAEALPGTSVKRVTVAAKDVAACLRSMVHVHLDLCTIVISPPSQENEATEAVTVIVKRDNDLAPTLGERHQSPRTGSFNGKAADQIKTRLVHLTLASKSGGSTTTLVPLLPCAVSHVAVPERPLALPTRNLLSHLVGGGLAVLSNCLLKLPARRGGKGLQRPLPATHMLTWQEGRLWLHQLQGATWMGWGEEEDELEQDVKAHRGPLLAPQPVPAALTKPDSENIRKRVREASISPAPSHSYHHLSVSIPERCSPTLPRTNSFRAPKATEVVRSRSQPSTYPRPQPSGFPNPVSKPVPNLLVIPNPTSLTTEPQSILSSPLQQSAELAALLRPITRAFLGDDLDRDKTARAERCVGRLWECTQANDSKLLPRLAESPIARQQVYRSLWKELWEMSRLFKNTSNAHQQLAQAIDFRQMPEPFPRGCPPPSPMPRQIERRRSHPHINKRRRCEEVPRDQGGSPILPLKVGPSLTILSLGRIVADRQTFHSDKYLWPVGFKSMRSYASMRQPDKRIQYCCEILDGGAAPEFRLTPDDDPGRPVVGVSATAVWTTVVKQVTTIRMDEGGRKTFANVSGPEYFGFANPTVARLLQDLPGAARCHKYKMQQYEPNVPMRNRSPGSDSPASTTASSSSWRRADSFGTSRLDDDVSISGWEHFGSDLGDSGAGVGFNLTPESLPGLSPDDNAAWIYSEANTKAKEQTGISSGWTGLASGAAPAAGIADATPLVGSKKELSAEVSWNGAGGVAPVGQPAGDPPRRAQEDLEPLDALWLLPADGTAGELPPGGETTWADLLNGLPMPG